MQNDRKKDYEKKRVSKRVSFNIEKEKHLLEFAKTFDFSKWVKDELLKKKESIDGNKT